MKINIEIDATPEEIRTFFGMPNVAPFQEDLLERLQENMQLGTEGYDPANLAKLFVPSAGFAAMEKFQKMFGDYLEAIQRKGADSSKSD